MKFFGNFNFKVLCFLNMCPIFSTLFIILIGLTITWYSEKMPISNSCMHVLIPNLIKKSWTSFFCLGLFADKKGVLIYLRLTTKEFFRVLELDEILHGLLSQTLRNICDWFQAKFQLILTGRLILKSPFCVLSFG